MNSGVPGHFTGVGTLVPARHGTSKLLVYLQHGINIMHPGVKQGELCGTTDLLSNVVLLSCQTQFINCEYRVTIHYKAWLIWLLMYMYLGFISTTTCHFFSV